MPPIPPRASSSPTHERTGRFLFVFLVLAFAIIATRRAWLSDDAYITFRVVDNFIHGYGLTWNVGERVQVYTHPLWMLLLSAGYFLFREMAFMPIALGILASGAAVALLLYRLSSSWVSGSLACLALLLSKAFVDYSTSGLENPLSYLLLVVFFILFFAPGGGMRKLGLLSLTASLGMLNRMDAALIFAPALVSELRGPGFRKKVGWLLLGQTPFLAWELFSLLYYGFPFPNTAYAKLGTGIDALELARQGLLYFFSSLRFDPLTAAVIVAGLVLPFLDCRGGKERWLALGSLLYLLYLVKIGGDFMQGRLLTLPLLCGAIALARARLVQRPPLPELGALALSALGLVLLLGLGIPRQTTLTAGERDAPTGPSSQTYGVLDERAVYLSATGIQNLTRGELYPDHRWVREGLAAKTSGVKTVVRGTVGMFGFFAGPGVHIIDTYALGDPLLARLPALRDPAWRVGHFGRAVPYGYAEAIESGRNLFLDPDIGAFYNRLSLITRGPIFSFERLRAILAMNLGHYNHWIDQDAYRNFYMRKIELSQLAGTGQQTQVCEFSLDSGIEIDLGQVMTAPALRLGLSTGDRFEIRYYRASAQTGVQRTAAAGAGESGEIVVQTIDVPPAVSAAGYDRIRILPLGGQRPYCLARGTLFR